MMHNKPTPYFSGWDIGGAHLKVARCDAAGTVQQAIELPSPLWLGLDQLEQALRQALHQLDNITDLHTITLTGELADIFPDRQTGVAEILNLIQHALPDASLQVYSNHGLIDIESARQRWQSVASMNWLATAHWLAQHYKNGLLLDIGSTTTDIIAIENGQPKVTAYDDCGRLASGELFYSGVIRTPLMAICTHAPFKGHWQASTAELFATMADCWCILQQLDPATIQDNSADGQDWRIEHCQRRLARMMGTDQQAANAVQWQQLAGWYAEQQIQQITDKVFQVLSNHSQLSADVPIIGAGIGRFIAKRIAQRLNRPYIDFADSLNTNLPISASYAPAVALTLIARHELIK